jgi:hypothetical protein
MTNECRIKFAEAEEVGLMPGTYSRNDLSPTQLYLVEQVWGIRMYSNDTFKFTWDNLSYLEYLYDKKQK